MSHVPASDDPDSDILRSVIEHVFLPPRLPQAGPSEETEHKTNVAICNTLIEAARDFLQNVISSQRPLWKHMIKMMELARRAATAPFEEADLQHVFSDMAVGGMFIVSNLFRVWSETILSDVFSMLIRAQNSALIVRRLALADLVQFEVFEVSPLTRSVMSTKGKLLCSYPGPVIQVPTDTFMDERFLRQLSSFLIQMDIDHLDSTPTISKAGSVVNEVRESVHPRYISELLVGILRGCGLPAIVDRITKRIGDEVLWNDAYRPWRRSPLWLNLRVSLQTSLRASNLYKPFMLFFHAHLLRTCVRRDFPSELLFAMRVKMTRRLLKLGPAVSHHVYEFVHNIAKRTEALLLKRWTAFQAVGSISPTLQPVTLDFAIDTHISLNMSYKYLTKTLRSASHSFPQTPFAPSRGQRLNNVHDLTHFTNGRLAQAIAMDRRIAIADFELSVENSLSSWVAASINNDDAPDVICSCIQQYFAGAKDLYGTSAEDNSVMILTIMDLWVALDTFTIQQCPLLRQYPPEIPSDFLHPLLLHQSSSLKRALHIEEHLRRRYEEASDVSPIFSNSINDSCFALKYFCASDHLQRLYDEIVTHAQQERVDKREELAVLNQTSKSLLIEASKRDHEHAKNNFGYDVHRATCRKCQLEHQAKALQICVHEWPLPPSTAQAQLAVFELSPPRAFSTWRDITYMILHDVGLPSVPDSRDQPKVVLDSFSGLERWAPRHQQDYRVTVGSSTKSFSDQTHYKMVGIPADESSVLVNNGLTFRLYDRIGRSWVTGPLSESSVAHLCAPHIPTSSPYSHLHSYVTGTQHTPNEFIAAQSHCPKEINLHEFLAFSGLRSGPRLQWLNIARELASPSLSFRREEVHTLITQAAWQLGPLSDGVREWHVDLGIPSFGKALLGELESLLEKIKANWLEEVTVRTVGTSGTSYLDFYLICLQLLLSAVSWARQRTRMFQSGHVRCCERPEI